MYVCVYVSDYSQRVDLVQDLRFETATTKIKATPDGEFLIASGAFVLHFIISFTLEFFALYFYIY